MPPINPIIPGFAPDPSVALIDGTFYLVNSTFHMFPGIPIYTSQDLTQLSLGRAVTSMSVLPNMPAIEGKFLSTGGLYAPTIRHHRASNTTYIVCTNIVDGDESSGGGGFNFILSTKSIHAGGPWSDPVYFKFPGIDPSLFFDDDSGKVYLHGSAGPIRMFEIDLATGSAASPTRELWPGTGGVYPEGPHIYKKDGWFYLVIAEGGTESDRHMVTVARASSDSIWGPYESCPQNPVLTARGTGRYVNHLGHAELFQDAHGKWWGVCLGVRKRFDGDGKAARYVLGRETFLTTVEWLDGEWPVIHDIDVNLVLPNGDNDGGQTTTTTTTRSRAIGESDPSLGFLYIRDAILSNHVFSNDFKTVSLVPGKGDFSQWAEPITFVGKRQRQLEGSTSVSMSVTSRPPPYFSASAPDASGGHLEAGLAYFKDEYRHVRVFYDFFASTITFEWVNKAKDVAKTVTHLVSVHDVCHLRVDYTETAYTFSYRLDDAENSVSFEAVDTLHMTGLDFVGPVIGVFAIGTVQDSDDAAGKQFGVQFDNLVVE
ncbi:hypothetical protein HK100_009295 [Physocladia obscura]|uniref:Beta-xylosidase C-terminal Concanavalin A-like domain-containing protein n=1 Tax=Physocladia obscura TaxID=109957 RepID=A0AAD5X7E4_9FUNG|nr:hypothetical protein HK100_009295 [Physocladia obscura]